MSQEVVRVPGGALGRCAAVAKLGFVYAVATDPACGPDISAQTSGALQELDRVLKEAGSSKEHLLQATVYLADIGDKATMDAVWVPWIGPEENWPQRACVGAGLDPGYLIEIVVTAEAA